MEKNRKICMEEKDSYQWTKFFDQHSEVILDTISTRMDAYLTTSCVVDDLHEVGK